MKCFTIVSPIAGGKTFLINKLMKVDERIILVDDSLNIIQNINGINFLDLYYKDLKRWSFTAQLLFFITRINKIKYFIDKYKDTDKILLLEGDYISSKYCFGNVLKSDMEPFEWELYEKIYEILINRINSIKIDGYIFIDCSLETHIKRMNLRGRPEEKNIDIKFQKKLIDSHSEFKKIIKNHVTLDGDVDDVFDHNYEKIKKFIEK